MKDTRKKILESSRPNHSASHCITHALNALFNDNTKSIKDEVVNGLTYEELIGTLLLAKDYCPQSVCLTDIDTNNSNQIKS
jgi:hypothetical protein